MASALGIELHPDVLPFSNIPAWLPPFLLDPDARWSSRDRDRCDLLVLEAGDARLTVDPGRGRADDVASWSAVHELLVTEGYGPIRWGSYPMAPWAGRIRDGRFRSGAGPCSCP